MSVLLGFVIAMTAGMIGGMVGAGSILIIFWPELARPSQLDDEILPAWRQHAELERNHDD